MEGEGHVREKETGRPGAQSDQEGVTTRLRMGDQVHQPVLLRHRAGDG